MTLSTLADQKEAHAQMTAQTAEILNARDDFGVSVPGELGVCWLKFISSPPSMTLHRLCAIWPRQCVHELARQIKRL
jgi:hypothetical protein